LNLQFQALANRIFDEKSEKFGQENRERVRSLLQPLQEQLRGFQKRIDDIQVNDIRERTSLKEEILHLRDLNQQINKEATNLTRALRGDKKRQGNWGELVLERVLEKSGLRKGSEYTTQQSFRNHEHQLRKPDVILHLPEGKDIIIDSKVSLSAWEKYITAEEEKEKEDYLAAHITNIRNHVKDLSIKDYSSLPGILTLDFVLLFIPIDSSFAVAADTDPNLFSDAYEQRIIIVTPTTLLATLQTIENLWRYEHQNRNAREIADRAGAIYDKLRGFLEDMDKVGKQLATCTSTYDSAMNKLARGKGNIISQAGRLTELGVKTKKKIPRSIRDLSDSDTPN
jgi:DNA recombination protein RmuC